MTAIDMLGLVAAALTLSGFAPQILKSYRTKKMEDISYFFIVLQKITFLSSLALISVMCFSYLKKNRNWALWLSGFFGMGALSALFLAIVNQPINVLGITVDRNLYLLRFVIQGSIAYLLLHYWGKAQAKRKRK